MNRFRQFMYQLAMRRSAAMIGRNGPDSFARTCSYTGLALLILNLFINSRLCYTLSLVSLTYALFRIYSKNLVKRQAENAKFLQATAKIRAFFRGLKLRWADRNTYRYFSCPNCHQQVRVPKGRGKIEITCPRCRKTFIKKS